METETDIFILLAHSQGSRTFTLFRCNSESQSVLNGNDGSGDHDAIARECCAG